MLLGYIDYLSIFGPLQSSLMRSENGQLTIAPVRITRSTTQRGHQPVLRDLSYIDVQPWSKYALWSKIIIVDSSTNDITWECSDQSIIIWTDETLCSSGKWCNTDALTINGDGTKFDSLRPWSTSTYIRPCQLATLQWSRITVFSGNEQFSFMFRTSQRD